MAKSYSISMAERVEAVGLVGAKFRRFNTQTLLGYHANILDLSERLRMTSDHDRTWMPHQYLALLFAERYFDRYFGDPDAFLEELNLWKQAPEWRGLPDYRKEDLHAFAVQSAHGSGKTLLMYANILQYRHYVRQGRARLNNVLLLTPGEQVSEHHERESRTSGLRARRFHPRAPSDLYGAVEILGFDQLADEQVTPIQFGDDNLVLVDRGHSGEWGRRWPQWRAEFGRSGSFIVEYSAGFGPDFPGPEPLRHAYTKSVLFLYGFREFHDDGYGKDYTISGLPRGMASVSRDR